ncbi:Hsp20 family protein [Hahella sp. CR1]|uniref:Hsp20 family protein n=1 Tax=Hahella sp. CR1 TaxID=2992807 RepID=UPI0024424ED6|nr:Hsp20 family protein [Hahella sp. CR1]MDG9669346.1 Hsp20 family protein [Hahella sp. CR1]
MNSIDLTPLYRNSVGFERLASLIDRALTGEADSPAYPPYNIEALQENQYAITLAVAGFARSELDITVEKNVLTVRGRKEQDASRNYLYQGIPGRTFERSFNLAQYVEVKDASLSNGLLTITLKQNIPESMKPKQIAINDGGRLLEHESDAASEERPDAANEAA